MAIGKIGVQMMMLKDKVAELGAYETMRKVQRTWLPRCRSITNSDDTGKCG